MRKIVCLMIGFVVFASCRERHDPDIPVSSIVLDQTQLTLEIGAEKTLSATVLPANATDPAVRWTSSAPDIAFVTEEGIVKALSEGSAVVTASAGSMSATCQVNVEKPYVAVLSITLDCRSMILPVGRSRQIGVTVLPADATDPSVSWSSSDPSVVKVSTEGVVTAISEGSAVISVTAMTGIADEIRALCDVVVIPPGPDATQIWYTSWSSGALTFGEEDGCGAHILSNEYSDGKGVITFDGEVTNIPTSLFKANTAIRTLSLPYTVKTISFEAFRDCSALLSVSLQEGITRIGGGAFQGCFSLRKLQMPSTVTSIGNYILRGDNIITTLTIPENVENIEDFALYGCSGLKSLTILRTKPATIGFRALDETGDCPIRVPASSVDAYKKASGWTVYASRIEAIAE